MKDPTPMKLFLLNETNSILVDSINIETEKFSLTGPIEKPGIYQLSFFNEQEIYLVLFPGDKIKLSIDNKYSAISYYVENSFESKRVKELMDSQNLGHRKIDQLSREWEMHKTDTAHRQRIDSAYMHILRYQKKFTKDFIYAHPKSLANIMAIYQNFGRKSQALFDPYDDFDLFRFVDSCLVSEYPLSAPVLALNKEVNLIKDEIRHSKFIKKIVEAGRPVPYFNHPDIKGDTLIIDENIGQASLLFFWASWNPYSVNELLALNKYYLQSSSEDLLIITISLDSSEEELQKFLADHPLAIPVVCDYKYWDSELAGRYTVKQIPSSLLSNKEGLILSKDIFSDELYNQINEVLR